MQKVIDEDYLDLIIDNTQVSQFNMGDNITRINDRYSILHVLNRDTGPCYLGDYGYNSFPAIYSLMSVQSLEQSGIIRVQNNPSLSLYGNGVIIGVIDTGIDYTHPAFLYKDQSSRIFSIWDQTIEGGTPPSDMVFGSEYNKEMINLALRNSDPLSIVPSVDTDGHGTAIASVIAGSENIAQDFRGVASESELVVVKLKQAKRNLREISFVPQDVECYQETDILLGVRYLLSVALRLQRPLAICIALGTNQGGHDGTDTLSKNLNDLVRIPGVGIAVAAGNEGNNRRHYYTSVDTAPYTSEFELRVGASDRLFAMEIWSYITSYVSVNIISPTGEMTNFVYPRIESCQEFRFVFEESKIWVNNIIFEEESGDQLILIRFEDAQEGIWRFEVNNLEDENFSFNSWLPAGNLLSDETFFLESSPDMTITTPGNASNPLTVTGYNSLTDSILVESSRGYTRSNRVKPDIAAPGFEITCALPNGLYGNLTGTGVAAAQATGIIAMLLEWAIPRGNYTLITGNDINKLIIRGADRDLLLYDYPNNVWGYGKIDVYSVLEKISL